MTALMKKHNAPRAVDQLTAARSIMDPVDGTMYEAIAEMPKSTQPSRLTAAIVHSRPRSAGRRRGPVTTR